MVPGQEVESKPLLTRKVMSRPEPRQIPKPIALCRVGSRPFSKLDAAKLNQGPAPAGASPAPASMKGCLPRRLAGAASVVA